MARIEWIEHRLQNWARWRLSQGSGPLGYASVNLSDPTPEVREPYAEAAIPIAAIDAVETDTAVKALQPVELQRAVIQFYTGRGGIRDHARALCCGESTVYARVDQAHQKLVTYFSERHAARVTEQRRVQALQASVRPGGGFTP